MDDQDSAEISGCIYLILIAGIAFLLLSGAAAIGFAY